MNGELNHLYHPLRLRIFWIIAYFLIAVVVGVGLYLSADQIRTHTLPSGQVQLTVPYSKYLVGETISFTIKNNFNSPIYIINNCPNEPLAVYLQQNGTWIRQHDVASESECPLEQRQVSVEANGVVNGNFAAWRNLFNQPGRYRVVAFVEYYNSLPYQEFDVVALPAPVTVVPLSAQKQTVTQPALPTSPTVQSATSAPTPTPTPTPNIDPGDQ